MYFNDDPTIHLVDILIATAVTTYDSWLQTFCRHFSLTRGPLVPAHISLRLPDIWERAEPSASYPAWATKPYFYADLRRPIFPDAPEALRFIADGRKDELEQKIITHGAMTFYVLEGLRLHLLTAAAHSAYTQATGGITADDIQAAAECKCWVWPWC